VALAACLGAALLGLATCGGRDAAGSPSGSPTGRTAPQSADSTSAGANSPRSAGAVPTAADAARALDALDAAFLHRTARGAYYAKSSNGATAVGFTDSWRDAEMLETVEDYADLTGSATDRRLVGELCRGLLSLDGTRWLLTYSTKLHRLDGARANDDIMWMVIAFTRAAMITGDRSYARIAAWNYERTYARAWSSTFGGGLWWWQRAGRQREKNATTNAPAVIAACELDLALHRTTYLSRAIGLYRWTRAHLFDARTGEVYDALLPGPGGAPLLSRVRFSYDQGSFVGAAGMLYRATGRVAYRRDALLALAYAKDSIAHGGVLPAEARRPGTDLGGFKGIFARWAVWFTRTDRITSFTAWLRLNAATAWRSRNARGLAGWDWTRTTSGPQCAWDCSSMPAMLECVAAR
jgi:hypothetical protein